MVYFLDTNAISDLMKRHRKAMARLAIISSGNELRTCTVVRGEILFGIDRLSPGKKQNELRSRADHIFSFVACDPVQPSCAEGYSQIKCTLEKNGTALGENDLWIAACAVHLGAVLVTRDHAFRQIIGLAVEDWTQ